MFFLITWVWAVKTRCKLAGIGPPTAVPARDLGRLIAEIRGPFPVRSEGSPVEKPLVDGRIELETRAERD